MPFIELGVHLFHTAKLPLNRPQIEHLSHHPLRLVRDIWQWEWHALIVWGIVSAIVLPLLAHVHSTGPGAADAPPSNADPFAPCGALIRLI